MKVLFLTHWYPTPETPGTGLFVQEQARAIAAAGVELTVLHIHIVAGPLLPEVSVEHGADVDPKVVRIRLACALWKFIYVFYPWQLRLVRRALRSIGCDPTTYDIVHSNVVHPAGVIGDRLLQGTGVPHIITEHWTRVEQYFSKDLLHRWGGRAYRRAAMILPVSAYLAGIVERYAEGNDRIHVVPNVVPDDIFQYQGRVDKNGPRFLMAAKWDRTKLGHKRPDLVIDALAVLQQGSGVPLRLHVVGAGDRIPELKARCLQRGVHAEFLGYRSKREIADLLRDTDLFLHPTERETFSVVVAEALKCGVPVVASNVGALPELVDATTGVLVENNVPSWTEGIRRAMTIPYDRRAIAAKWSERFSAKEVGARVLALYRTVLSSR